MIVEKDLATRLLLSDFDSDNLEIVPLGLRGIWPCDVEGPGLLPYGRAGIFPLMNDIGLPVSEEDDSLAESGGTRLAIAIVDLHV